MNEDIWKHVNYADIEYWKAMPNYEGIYMISSWGRVKALPSKVHIHNAGDYYTKEKILVLCKNSGGYYIFRSRDHKSISVHRMVALAFLGGPPNPDKNVINHKDENKTNNRVDNLEWCTTKYNVTYGAAIQKRVEKQSKKVAQYSLDGTLVAIYPSASEAARQTGFEQSLISAYCRGERKTAYGYIWKYIKGGIDED
ncbi:MAG: HNH endonuclease [Alphaproteobacteria bacterium]|nr:HNH endonuclease [Alphaproteobacteria bacterium]